MKFKHIIVTRLALKWRFSETRMDWREWLKDSINLMNSFCRPSLRNQINQDFTLLSIVDDSVDDVGELLDNEVVLKVPSLKNNEYPKQLMIDVVNEYVGNLKGYDSIILTRLDRDDALKKDFIQKVQNYLADKQGEYIDLNNSITYDYYRNEAHNSKKYFNTFVSPFVSVHEPILNGKITCLSLKIDHDAISRHIKGKKVNDLWAMQVIHKNNLRNRIYGDVITINKNDFGI